MVEDREGGKDVCVDVHRLTDGCQGRGEKGQSETVREKGMKKKKKKSPVAGVLAS